MNNRTHILTELESIAPVLVTVPAAMPYTVPELYFETLQADLFNTLGLDENHAFGSNLVTISKENVYTLPHGYFDGLADVIMYKICTEENKSTVPEGYFSTLPDLLLGKIHGIEVQEELEDVAPLLNNIDKKPVNFVPTGYFENLEPAMEAHVLREITEVKVLSIKKNTRWLKYGVAACIAGAIVFTGINIIGNQKIVTPPVVAVAKNIPDVPEALSKISDSTIENYLAQEESLSEFASIAYQAVNNEEIEDVFKDFTDEDLQQHLKNEGEELANN